MHVLHVYKVDNTYFVFSDQVRDDVVDKSQKVAHVFLLFVTLLWLHDDNEDKYLNSPRVLRPQSIYIYSNTLYLTISDRETSHHITMPELRLLALIALSQVSRQSVSQ